MNKNIDIRVGGKYKVTHKLGQGAFGDIYAGINIKTNEEVAIKLEKLDFYYPVLQYEAKVYQQMKGAVGFPTMHWCGIEGAYNACVLSRHGPDLSKLFKFCD